MNNTYFTIGYHKYTTFSSNDVVYHLLRHLEECGYARLEIYPNDTDITDRIFKSKLYK